MIKGTQSDKDGGGWVLRRRKSGWNWGQEEQRMGWRGRGNQSYGNKKVSRGAIERV